MQRILIVGGGAFCESFLNNLSGHEFDVTVISRGSINKKPKLKLKLVRGDLTNCDTYSSLSKENFDCAIYLAASWSGLGKSKSIYHENINPFKFFLKHMNENIERLIILSSSAVYKNQKSKNLELIDTDSPSYGLAKLHMENLTQQVFVNRALILRPFHIVCPYEQYSPGRSHVLTDFIYKRLHNMKIKLDKKVFVPFLDADDLSVLLIKLIHRKYLSSSAVNVGPEVEYSLDYALSVVDWLIGFKTTSPKLVLSPTSHFEKSFKQFGKYANTNFEKTVQKGIDTYGQ